MRINHETGCIYDTLAFFSAYFEDSQSVPTDTRHADISQHYLTIKLSLQQNHFEIPNYLYPFFCRWHGDPFLYKTIFDCKYSECTMDRLLHILNNKQYTKRSFVAHYFPDADTKTVNQIIRMDHLSAVETLLQNTRDRFLDSCFIYTLMHFDAVLKTLSDVVQAVCKQIDILRRSVFSEHCASALKREEVFPKLKAITHVPVADERNYTVSMLLMNPDAILFRADEPHFVLLGYDFEKLLNTTYKYCDVSLYSFAQAIASNPVKYEIFNALLIKSPMTAADLSIQLNLNRSALDYNLKEMMKSRLLTAELINKRTYGYRINHEYLRVIYSQISMSMNSVC